MGNKFKFSLFAFVMQSFVTSLCAAEIRLAEAPFGLQFGMRAEDVKLPISPVPNKPWRLQQRLSNNGFGIDIPTAEEIREEDQYNAQYVARESLIKGCIKSFDSPYLSNYGDASWFEWTHSKGISSELSDLHPRSLLDSPQYDLYFKFQEQIDKIEFPHPDAFRSVSIHTVKAAGIDRDVCLIFTEVGLAYVYAPLKALEDVINEIYVRLAANSEYENYLSRSKYITIENQDDYRFVTERQIWLNKSRKIMVSAKRVQAYTGLEGFWKTAFLENDFKDDLLPFISYTDLLRRGHTFARYREKTLPPLSAAVRDVFEAVDASKKLKDEIERAKRDLENMDRKGLIEGFQ